MSRELQVQPALAEPFPLLRTTSSLQSVRVGVCAPDEVARKLSYALEELLAAAGVPHHVQRTDSQRGWDLFYGDRPPADDGLWMVASAEAGQFFARPGGRVESVVTVRVAGEWIRLPAWNARGGAAAEQNAAPQAIVLPVLPDLAAAAFFFLSQWEEWRASERDRFGRFPLSASVFGRGLWSLTECPVERYARALRRALADAPRTAWLSEFGVPASGSSVVRMAGDGETDESSVSDRRPAFVLGLSHDVDTVRRWDARGFARTGRAAVRALLKRQVHAAAWESRQLAAGIRARAVGRDPHDNLEEIVRLERAAKAKSTFFLLARHSHAWDGTHASHYLRRLPSLATTLGAEAEVGLHASTAAADTTSLCEERSRLSALTDAAVRGVRFHNLRGGYPALPDVATAGFTYDSSLAFAEEPGFPTGIARPFRPYDREKDRPLDLVEIPLALMDTTLLSRRYLGLDARAGRQRALLALEPLRQWGGTAALLWHNDNLPPNEADGYAALYAELIEWTRAAGGQVATLGEIADHWQRARVALQGESEDE